MNVTHLYCSSCSKQYEPRRLYNLCTCGKPLLVCYDLENASRKLKREALFRCPATLWRYREVLPVAEEANIVSLGEGFTPLVFARQLSKQLGLRQPAARVKVRVRESHSGAPPCMRSSNKPPTSSSFGRERCCSSFIKATPVYPFGRILSSRVVARNRRT